MDPWLRISTYFERILGQTIDVVHRANTIFGAPTSHFLMSNSHSDESMRSKFLESNILRLRIVDQVLFCSSSHETVQYKIDAKEICCGLKPICASLYGLLRLVVSFSLLMQTWRYLDCKSNQSPCCVFLSSPK